MSPLSPHFETADAANAAGSLLRPIGQDSVADDFIWLRDPHRGQALREFLRRERTFYDQAAVDHRAWQDRLTHRALELLPATSRTPAWNVGVSQFHWEWAPAAEHPRLLRTAVHQSADDSPAAVLDVASLSDTGFVRLGDTAVAPDGNRLAYTVDVIGDEAYQLRVRDLSDGTEDVLSDRVYYGLAWTPDGTGLLSITHDTADRPHQLWCHHPGTEQPAELLHEERDERFHLMLRVSADGSTAILRAASRLSSEEWLIDLGAPVLTLHSAGGRRDGHDYFVEPLGIDGQPHLAVCAETGEDQYQLTLHPGHQLDSPPLRMLLGPAPTRRPWTISAHDNRLVVTGRETGAPTLWVLDPVGSQPPRQLTAPAGSTFSVAPYDSRPGTICLAVESLTDPPRYQTLHLDTGECELHLGPEPAATPRVPLLIEQLSVPARDGADVPVTILRRADVPLDGTAPCLLYGYGAWETVIEPTFEPARLALVEAGVVYAHAHIRGGGELGRAWWRAGRMQNKQRTFDDHIDVATHLADSLVDPARIVTRGLSAGGLLMGAVYSQAPELFAGVIAEAPFVDPVTTMSDPSAPLVIVERDEWGDPRRAADREWMLGWSPYDNPPAPHRRPRLLVTSAIHDPRVSVWEPARWVAKLRQDEPAPADLLFRVDLTARGHWPPPGRIESVRFHAELLAWAAETIKLPPR